MGIPQLLYTYKLKLHRQRDSDAYTEQHANLEKELTEKRRLVEDELTARQNMLTAQENELQALRAKAASMPADMEEAVAQAHEKGYAEAEREARHARAALQTKEIEGERRLQLLRIETLQTKVNDQAARLESLSVQLAAATGKVQDIAVKAIEGAAGRRALEQAKQKRTP